MRRPIFAALIAVALLAPATANATDWPGYRGGPAQNPASATYPGTTLDTIWTAREQDGTTNVLSNGGGTCVAAANGRFFAVALDPDDPGFARLYAVSATTGATIWRSDKFGGQDIERTCPAVDANGVYVSHSFDGTNAPRIRGYNPATGGILWTFTFGLNGGDATSPLTVSGGVVYFTGYGGDCGALAQPCEFAVNATTGSQVFAVGGGAQAQIAPIVLGTSVIQGLRSADTLVGFATSNGATQWTDANAIRYGAAGDGSDIFYSIGSNVVRRPAGSATATWTSSPALTAGRRASAIVVDGARVYAEITFSNNATPHVIAYDRTNGQFLWEATESGGGSGGTLWLMGNRLMTERTSFDPATGAVNGTYPAFPVLSSASPAYVDGTFFAWVANDTNTGYLLQAKRDATGPTVTPASPAASAFITDHTPTFSWTASDGAGSGLEHLELWINGSQVGPDIAPGDTQVTTASMPDGSYPWQLKGFDALGNETDTASRTLVIDSTDPGAFSLSGPSGTITTASPAFTWTPASDAPAGIDNYRLSVDNIDLGAHEPAAACGPASCGVIPVTVLPDGSHTWSVIATDRAGNSRTQTGSFTVQAPPVAALTVTGSPGLTGAPIALDASGSHDPNGGITAYDWDLDGDGSFETSGGTSPTLSRTYSTPGVRNVAVRASDAGGLTGTSTATVDIRPAPPSGLPGVSVNNGAIATNDPNVTLRVVWVPLATTMTVANDGGFNPNQVFPVAASLPWTLVSSGPERLPKTVYLRFDSGRETYTDDIILDQTPPAVSTATAPASAASAAAAAVKAKTLKVSLAAADNASGVVGIQFANNKKKPAKLSKVKRALKVKTSLKFKSKGAKAYVRVRDAAGNYSAWKQIKAAKKK